MPKYCVQIDRNRNLQYYIEADSPEEAEKIAWNKYNHLEPADFEQDGEAEPGIITEIE